MSSESSHEHGLRASNTPTSHATSTLAASATQVLPYTLLSDPQTGAYSFVHITGSSGLGSATRVGLVITVGLVTTTGPSSSSSTTASPTRGHLQSPPGRWGAMSRSQWDSAPAAFAAQELL